MSRALPGVPADRTGRRAETVVAALVLLAIALAVVALRLRLLEVPLERDEGDYAYHAQLLLQGVAPYTGAYEMRLPGIFVAYAAVLGLLGETREGLHLGLLLVNLTTLGIVFWLGRRAFGALPATAAAAVFAAVTLSPATLGFTANTEHFVLLPALAGLALLVGGAGPLRLLVGGAALGVAILMKQHGVVFAALGAALVVLGARSERGLRLPVAVAVAALAWLVAGIVLPIALAVGWIAASGAFERFWFWTVVVPADYVTSASAASAWNGLALSLPDVLRSTWSSWLLAAAGLALLAGSGRLRPVRPLVLGLAAASLLAVCVGFTFRSHAWLFAAPALGLLAAVAVAAFGARAERVLGARGARAATVALCLLPLVQLLVSERAYAFRMRPAEISRARYGLNPFPESIEVGRYLREHSAEGDTVAVLGSEPQIYFYARRRSASPYILVYGLLEPQPHARAMQQEMVAAIERAQPRFLVHVGVPTSWLLREDSDRWMADWMVKYTAGSYRRVGLVEIGPDGSRYHWGADRVPSRAATDAWLSIHERIPGR